jgi:hypothetical protein
MATTGTNSPMRYTPGAKGAGDGGYGIQGHKGGGHSILPNENSAETERLNRFAHQSNNVVPSATPVDVKIAFQPNLLDNYDAVTYHFKLFMVSTNDASTGNVLNIKSQVVIAESGVSDLTIDKVELDAIAVPSVEAGTGTQTTMKFEIVEPSGAGLLDKMYYESIDLGIGNWAVMPLYLQVEFRGRDPKTSNSDADGGAGALGNLRWLWALKITDIKANVTTVGTRYSFSAIMYNELAQSNASFSLQHNITLANIATFQEAIDELEDKINRDQIEKLIDNYSKPDVYKFVVDPVISGYHIKSQTSNQDSARNGAFKEFDGKAANFNSGTSIDKIIDTLLAHTEEYQTKMAGSKSPGAEGEPITAEISQMKSFWRIITESRPIVFDPRRNDNAVEYTIFIIAYDIGVLDTNVFQTTGITPEVSKKRFATYANKALLKKKYNYIFTGLNDQIVSLDLNFNQSFATALTRYGGIYVNPGMKDYGTTANENAANEKKATESLRKLISLKNDAATSPKQLITAVDEYQASVSAAKLPQADIDRNNALIEAMKPGNKLNLALYDKNYKIDKNNTNSQNLLIARKLATPITDNVPGFVSDVALTGKEGKKTLDMYNNFLKDGGGQLRPVAMREGSQQAAVGAGAEAASNSGISKLSTIFSTALHSSVDVNLISIKLSIKGDPFWLFPQPVQDNNSVMFNSLKDPADAIAFLKNGQSMMPASVNLFGGDNFILIRFRTPRIFNTTTNDGNTDPYTEVETFSGVYKVITVKSRFEMGKFVQDLECLLDPVINLTDISELIEFDAGNQDIPTTVQDFLPSKKYNASNAPDQSAAETARLNAGIITPADADLERLKRTTYNTTSEAQQARLLKAIKG